MGRHRRSGPAAAPDNTIRSTERGRRGAHRRAGHPRAGLLGASAALTVGAVAVGTGLLPQVAEQFEQNDSREFRADDDQSPLPLDLESAPPSLETDDATGESTPDGDRSPGTSPEPDPESTEDAGSPSADGSGDPSGDPSSEDPGGAPTTEEPSDTPTTDEPDPEPSTPPVSDDPTTPGGDAETVAAREVMSLVNEERADAGCEPLISDPALARLAADHSRDMAERGYFSHDDPDGRTPWDRAEDAGIDNLGGENIAMGQVDAAAVMDAWMNSEGHRANILNCDFRTLGVGVHLADGGPWWTQNFGF